MLQEFLDILADTLQMRRLCQAANGLAKGEAVTVRGIAGSLDAVMTALLHQCTGRQVLLVVNDNETCLRAADDLRILLDPSMIKVFNEDQSLSQTHSPERKVENIDSLRNLLQQTVSVVVVQPGALGSKLPEPEQLRSLLLSVEPDKSDGFEYVIERLHSLGFERKDFVQEAGDFAVRGGIIDVHSFVAENPVRLEFFGDRLESLREFDPLSQRSIRELSATTIVPDLLSQPTAQNWGTSLLEYLRHDALIVLDEPARVSQAVNQLITQKPDEYERFSEIIPRLETFPRIMLSALATAGIEFHGLPQPAFNGSIQLLRSHLRDLLQNDFRVFMASEGQSELRRLKDLLLDSSAISEEESEASEEVHEVRFLHHSLHHGFHLTSPPVAFYTEHEVFGRRKRRGRPKSGRIRGRGLSLQALQQMRKGDYVVHVDYGIGRFEGMKKVNVQGIDHEVLKISYDVGDLLYVNLNYVNRVQKYSSQEGHVPKLSRLGGSDWQNLKSRAKRRIKDIARDLIRLYGKRKATPGFAFPSDSPWQHELEASFVFEDTFDQARATVDVKKDMESPHPMDRLICGDVGFGKTEVAVRAAFKSVLSGKQVAVLVPTTILALQHYNTFRDRLSRYSVNIAMLSRFKSKMEQTHILNGMAAGTVDITIGTHRLLSNDVAFKNLGLLIVDEEHRFGVAAKERLRRRKVEVDTLTLTATPIPRTLQFSLMGARDLSIIATPPRNRLPIITEIIAYDEDLIRDSILREIQRGGQVFFVHDRARDIAMIAERIMRIVPGVGVRFAHGQMHTHELENVMVDFLEKRFEVLVCTKIIESGLDLPNVNTILVNRADRFGMAELYQLRGRVGRSNAQAYAFLIVPPLTSLSRAALERLQAMREFTELGSGFHLAMRDLEIRGAGNLLGGEQSGFIINMGFETYIRTVDEAISELKLEEFRDIFQELPRRPLDDTSVEIEVEAFIPQTYISNEEERLEVYRRLYQVTTEEQIVEIEEELRDRFGQHPPQLRALLRILRLRLEASKYRFRKVKVTDSIVFVEFPPKTDEDFYESPRFQSFLSRVSAQQTNTVRLKVTPDGLVVSATLDDTSDILEATARAFRKLTSYLDPVEDSPPVSLP
jgi:transcription-repair coupling factor (superfamily II helicase)